MPSNGEEGDVAGRWARKLKSVPNRVDDVFSRQFCRKVYMRERRKALMVSVFALEVAALYAFCSAWRAS